jgi:hypothetical protein
MARLPIPDVTPVLTEAPRSNVNGAIFQQPQSVGIGAGLQALSEGVDEIAKTVAAKEGAADAQAALQRNADGSVDVIANKQNHFILGPAAKAYEHAYQVGSLAAMETNVNEKAVELRNEFRGDPQGFRLAMGKFADSVRANFSGPLGQAAFNHAVRLGSQHYIGAVEEKRQRDTEASYQDITTRIGDLKTEIGNIAGATVGDSPEFLAKSPQVAQLEAYYRSLGDNPNFKHVWTDTKIESELRLARQEAVNQWAIGNAQRVRDRDGVDAAIKWSERNVRDANSNMEPGKREAAHNMVVARIRTLTEEQRAQAQASSAAVDGFTKLYQDGMPPTQEQYEAVLDSARRSFDVAGAAKLQAFHDAYLNSVKPFAGLSPREGVAGLMGPQPVSAGQPFAAPNIESFLDKVKRIENPTGNPAAVSPTGARGDFQFTRATWTQFGQGDINNPADNRAAAARLAAANAQTLRMNLGRAPTEGEVYLAHQQGAAGASALLQHPDENAVAALSKYAGLTPEEAARNIRVNGGNTSMTAGEFARKWVSRLDGPQIAGPASPIPFSADNLRRNPYLAAASATMFTHDRARQVEFAKNQAELITKAIGLGAAPDTTAVAQVLQIAQQNPDKLGATATKMLAQVKAAPVALAAAGMPDGGAAYVAEAEQIARSSPDLYHMEFANALKGQIEGRTKALKDDPHAYAARSDVGWIKNKPVPMEAITAPQAIGAETPAQALSAAVAQRRQAGFQIAPRLGVAPEQAMFTEADVRSVAGLLQRADGTGASMILRGLEAELKPPEMQALSSQKDFTNAVSGLARSGDPAKVGAAYGFLDKQWRENPEAFKKEFGADMADKIAVWNSRIAFMDQESAARELMRWNDPAYEKVTHEIRKQAHDEIKDLTPADIAKKVSGDWMTHTSRLPAAEMDNIFASSIGLLSDYRENYAALRASGADKSAADAEALKRINAKWGASDANGGRVMAYPPERHYPPDINGSHAYIQNQLSNAIDDVAKARGDARMRDLERALVSDDKTQEDIANRKPPRYRVVVMDNGRWLPLEAAPGVPLRFRADAQSVIEGQTQDYLVRRRQSGFMQGAM